MNWVAVRRVSRAVEREQLFRYRALLKPVALGMGLGDRLNETNLDEDAEMLADRLADETGIICD